jgi:hypothetical protein
MTKNFVFTYPQSKCVCKVSSKTDTFCGLFKTDKNCHVKCLTFSTKLCLFYTCHITCRFVVKQLYGHVASKDVSVNFWFQFFDISKYAKYVFQNKGRIYSEEPKHQGKTR